MMVGSFEKVPTSREVCERCCAEKGVPLRWGRAENEYEGFWEEENSFYCPVTKRTVHHPDRIGSVQPDCPKKLEHLRVASPHPIGYQGTFFDVLHEGSSPERLDFSAEESVFLEQWQKANIRSPGINSGCTLLEHILCSSTQYPPPPVSSRDAYVAASVIQWLGTNCGRAFLKDCEKKIPEIKKARKVADCLCGRAVW